MDFERVYEGQMDPFTASGTVTPADERELLEVLVRTIHDCGLDSDDLDPVETALLEDVLFWRLVTRRLERRLAAGPLFSPAPEAALETKAQSPPLLEPVAKARERMRKALKELYEAKAARTNTTRRGVADEVKPILKKAEGVLDDALEPDQGAARAAS